MNMTTNFIYKNMEKITEIIDKPLVALVLSLATTISFSACGDDNDDYQEPTNVILSEETTPITFDLPKGKTFLFDYAGNNLIMSDTFEVQPKYSGEKTLDMRQGKHILMWLTGLDTGYEEKIYDSKGAWQYNYQVHFNTKDMTVSCDLTKRGLERDIQYCQKDMEILQYLMPVQQLSFSTLTCILNIIVTDSSPLVNKKNSTDCCVGYMYGFPNVRSVGVTTPLCKRDDDFSVSILHYEHHDKYTQIVSVMNDEMFICPLNGIDNIQLKAVINGDDGENVPTTKLPKFSLKRGYKTTLKGPLFSGSTSDWEVIMESYEEL